MAQLLEFEYKQWLFITKDLYSYFYDICQLENKKEKQEGANVIQHWLLVINEDKTIPKYRTFPLLSQISIDNEVAQKLVNAIIEKNFFWRNRKSKSKEAVEKLLKYIELSQEKYNMMQIDFEPTVLNGNVCYGDFKGSDFYNLLTLLNKYPLNDVTTMLLRYESLGNGSYQWGDPMELYLAYYTHYNIRYEGFASPINSRFLTLPNCRFCSLFPEIDSQFGSMGNFFEINLEDYPGGWSVNPPFVNSVLEDASKKVIAALKAGTKSMYFCTYPLWEDCEGWKLLELSKYLVKKFHRKNGCVIQDAFGNIIRPPMGLSLFCLSYKSNINFDMIEKIINNDTWTSVTKNSITNNNINE